MQTAPADTPPVTAPPLAALPRRRKAALIVQLLLNDGNPLSLTRMPEHVQAELTRELGRIRLVDQETLQAVASEFSDLLASIGLSAPGDEEAALAALSDHISPGLARKLRADLDARHGTDPWVRLTALEVEDLNPILLAESIEVGAVIVSKLLVTKAADLLASLPGERARRVTIAVGQTEGISPDAVQRIGHALVEEYCNTPVTAFAKTPVDRIGAILNSSVADVREDMLDGLTGADEALARDVRRAIFTFADIPTRMVPTDIPATLRDVAPYDLSNAVGYALAQGGDTGSAAEFILSNLSQRLAAQVREEAEERGAIKKSDGEKALNAVTAKIRELADAGTIRLIDPDAEDD